MSPSHEECPVRVCLWAPLPPPDGGISRWTSRFLRESAKYGIAVELVDVSPGTSSFTERSRFSLTRSQTALRALSKLWRVLRKGQTDVCHVTTSLFWGTPRDFLAILMCRMHGIPTVLNIRASSQIIAWREDLDVVRRFLLDTVLRSATVVVVLSSELQAYLDRELPTLDVVRIPNMVASEEVMQAATNNRSILPPRRTRYRVLFVGFRTPMKGLGDLADAILQLPDCELVAVGDTGGAIDPSEQARMDDSLGMLRAAGRLLETGALEPDVVTAVYREVDIFALPSYREGLPNVLLEAMAAGLPCIATPVGAIPDVVEDGCGILVPVGDPKRLRDALGELLTNPLERQSLGHRARARITSRYGVATVVGTYRALYQKLIRT